MLFEHTEKIFFVVLGCTATWVVASNGTSDPVLPSTTLGTYRKQQSPGILTLIYEHCTVRINGVLTAMMSGSVDLFKFMKKTCFMQLWRAIPE